MTPKTSRIEHIDFGDHRRSRAVFASRQTPPCEIVSALAWPYQPDAVISVCGGAGLFPPRLAQPIAAILKCIASGLMGRHRALWVDGGTESGVMRLMGEVVHQLRNARPDPASADEAVVPLLTGFAPAPLITHPLATPNGAGRTPLDPNHQFFVLLEDATNWGDEVELVGAFLSHLRNGLEIPVATLVVNGGRITIKEVYHAVARGEVNPAIRRQR